MSYIIVAGYFLLNIVVAVLLDEFVSSVTAEREAQAICLISYSKYHVCYA